MNTNKLKQMAAWACALCSAGTLLAQADIEQWDFTNGDLTATAGGSPLQYADGSGGPTQIYTQFGTTAGLGLPSINGTNAQVMMFPAATNGMGYLMPTTPSANGGGGLINDYTLIMDVLYPSTSNAKLRPIIDTDGSTFVPGPDIVVSSGNGLGISDGPFFSNLATNTWYRIGFVVQQDQNTITEYINGQKVGANTVPQGTQQNADGRFALPITSSVLILGSTSSNAAPGYVGSIQFRDTALNAGQMKALGGPSAAGIPQTIPPVPSFIDSRTPDVNEASMLPTPDIHVVLNQGDTTVDPSSIQLYMDGTLVPATITPSAPTFTIDYNETNSILRPLSRHKLDLVYSDSVAGLQTNSWTFTVMNFQDVALPQPFYLETFDELTEGTMPSGWVVTNETDTDQTGYDLNNPHSDAFKDWVVINTNTVYNIANTEGWDPNARLGYPPVELNGKLINGLMVNNFAYAESDQRSGNQVKMMFTADIDCTGHTNVYVAWNQMYLQNQDNCDGVEYSVDGGTNWLPVGYYLPTTSGTDPSHDEIIYNSDGSINVAATFGAVRNNQAWDLAYSNWIAAPITQELAPYIRGYVDDELNYTLASGVEEWAWIGKDIEIHRLPLADNTAHVKLRFFQAGTASWFFGIDNLGLYSINTPVVTTPPVSQTVEAGTPVTFTVAASGSGPFTYQWEFYGNSISGATNSAYTISEVSPSDAGAYDLIVSNADGPITSPAAQLTVITSPEFVTQPYSQVSYVNGSVTFNASALGGQPMSYQWDFDGTPISGADTNSLTLDNLTTSNAGDYALVLSNSFGVIVSSVAHLTVYSGAITNGLVAHLLFNGDYTDSTGNGNNGTPVGTPTFEPGIIGQAVHITSSGTPAGNPATNNYVTLGYPADLNFGTNDISISFWAKIFYQHDDKPFIANKDWSSGSNPGWALATEGGGMKWNIRDNLSSRRDSSEVAPQLEDGNWHNVVVTFIRDSVGSIYVDGQLMGAYNVAPDSGNPVGSADTTLAINIGQDGTGLYTDGGGGAAVDMLMDDLGIWDRALAPSEVSSIYAQGENGQNLTAANGTIVSKPVVQLTTGGGKLNLTWPGATGVMLQRATSLNPPNWITISNTDGSSSYSPSGTNTAAFYRLIKP